ncbi:hypothetical protein [Tenacibaculum ovolyticum]|uniref:hypothetical protein n=1 Tax=Tenacibaculum ovolyticum TaxID=104270 RepID=UPI000AEB6B61|nr:hypothetical protein [Tenacibaculum ovolyticum]
MVKYQMMMFFVQKVFQYINDSIRLKLPFKVSVNDCTIVFNENDVTYEDGTVEMNTKEYFGFYLIMKIMIISVLLFLKEITKNYLLP